MSDPETAESRPRKRKRRQKTGGGAGEPRRSPRPNDPNLPLRASEAERSLAPALLFGSAMLATLGLALTGTGPSDTGRALFVAGLLGLLLGIHSTGRLGPEAN